LKGKDLIDVIENPNNKLPKNLINNFELEIGAKLPECFREFIIKYNGGMSGERYCILFEDREKLYSSGTEISRYYGFGEQCSPNFEYGYKLICGDVPDLLVPFAKTAGGNVLLISLRNDSSYGMVYYFGHEFEHSVDGFNEKQDEYPPCIVKVCSSFKEFLEKLDY
jgi:hypothetical protein